jgi:prepilin-type processing-associated H-X9-DG protein
MSSLNNEQKQLVFDYCLCLTSEKESAEAEALISSNKEAAQIHSKLLFAIAPLDSLEMQSCPDELAEITISRLNSAADSSQFRLQQLLAEEQGRPVIHKVHFWHNLTEMAAVAAAIILVAGVLIPPLSFARQRYWQQRCQMQLSNIFQGIQQYRADNDDKLPLVTAAPGTPWNRVGYQGSEDYSNTRSLFRLVKGRYVKNPADFVCPARSQGRALQFDISQVQSFNDFPARRYVTYSPRIVCIKFQGKCMTSGEPLMADSNPIFENLPEKLFGEIKLRLNDKLLTINSTNHNGRGQNILFGDGSVKFIKTRSIGITNDDIFTLQDMGRGFEVKGCEVPSRETDAFLAP